MMDWCSLGVWLAITAHLGTAALWYAEARAYRHLVAQYQRYVARLEAVVSQLTDGEFPDGTP